MSTVTEIIEAVSRLEEQERAELFRRLTAAYPEKQWDQQMWFTR